MRCSMLIIRLVTHRRKTCLPCFPLLLPLLMSTTAVAEYCYYTPPEKGGRKTKKCRLRWGGGETLTNLVSSVPAMGGKTRRRRNKSFSWKNAAMRHEGFGERGGGRGSWNGILVRPYDMLPLYHNVWELQHSFFCEFLKAKPWSCSFPFAVGSGIERGGRRYYCLSSFLLLCLLVWENGGSEESSCKRPGIGRKKQSCQFGPPFWRKNTYR